jgi:signal transduction histidine kinase/CheY-like chemotaxis protein
MTHRALRIRDYVGTIVAACATGGLLLAFWLAFLFQSLERRSAEHRQGSTALAEVDDLRRGVEDWLRDTRAALGDQARLKDVQQRLEALLVRLEKLRDAPENAAVASDFALLRLKLELVPEGAGITLRAVPGTAQFEQDRALVLDNLGVLESVLQAGFHRIGAALNGSVQLAGEDLNESRGELWRTALLLALAYGVLVLVLWRWVAARLLHPLQELTRESRRTLNGDTGFHLRPVGPHEVRLLTESLSTLVGNLVGARGHLEEKVKERTLELERANRAKNEFLANMSHEIRTPMTAILGYAELCLAPDIPETDRRRYAEIIHQNGEHLLAVINDILDVSKIEAGRMTVEPTLCSPFEVAQEVRALLELRAREKGLELSVEMASPVPELVRTDPTRLRQILLNLLNNAIKFTDKGGVVLRFGMEGGSTDTEAGAGEKLVFEVRDTGVGLTREQLERVFLPFVQADTSTTRKYGGSGLGLTISQTLARLLGGDLTCQSEPGRGSTFRVLIDPGPLQDVRRLEGFPASQTDDPPAALPSRAPGPEIRGRVLLAEDVVVNRRLISTILLRTGIHVEEAENGRVAVEKTLAARDAGEPFDIVFMDMQMPEMDGYDATTSLRQAGYLRPIVALTSHSMSSERQRCLDVGCDDYMTKPIDRLVLLQVLARFLPSQEAERHLAT